MKLRMVYAALAVVALSAPAVAEPLRIWRQDASSTLLLAQAAPGILPPYEILTIVRSTGLDPLGQPFRRGPNYVLRAIDDGDREVRVLVSARTGDIVSVTPLAVASRTAPGGLTMGPYEPMPPDGYIPPERPGAYRGGPPTVYEDDEPEPYAPRPPASVRGSPPSGVSAMPPPVIRATPSQGAYVPPPSGSRVVTRAPIRGAELPPPSEPNVIASTEPDIDGMLPPPPERFPQRAASPSAAKPKPVKRAAASVPKQAPLPRPRPGNSVEASPPTPLTNTEKKPAPEPIAE